MHGVDDHRAFEETRTAMRMIGMPDSEQSEVMRTVAAILHVGNINFEGGSKATVANPDVVKIAARLLCVTEDELAKVRRGHGAATGWNGHAVDPNARPASRAWVGRRGRGQALTNKTMDMSKENVTVPLNKDGAIFARDSLAKSMYACAGVGAVASRTLFLTVAVPACALPARSASYGRLFDWIVLRCNALMTKEEHEGFTIGVLDIYGFEIFDRNSFEQLCINFCNEKLHQVRRFPIACLCSCMTLLAHSVLPHHERRLARQVFIELTLKAEQDEYRRENIKWEDVQFYNNKPCVEIIEKKTGILGFLDEECVFPKGRRARRGAARASLAKM